VPDGAAAAAYSRSQPRAARSARAHAGRRAPCDVATPTRLWHASNGAPSSHAADASRASSAGFACRAERERARPQRASDPRAS